jgi:MarR family 2-MHQ and catechol resistance regulon transcriptional repressor
MGTHFAGTDEEIRALNSYIKLSRASEEVSHTINSHLREHGLSLSQFGVLEALYHLGPMTVGHLGEKILRTSGNMTLVVDNLFKRGLVDRQRCPEDRRRVDVTLTDEGRALLEQVWPEHLDGVVAAFGVLTPEEQEQLGALCRKLGLGQAEISVTEPSSRKIGASN